MNIERLAGTELDFWCAKALEGNALITGRDKYGAPILAGTRSLSFLIQKYADFPQVWSPATKWEDAGPIIEQMLGAEFRCATLRAFVAARLGDK